MIYNNTEFILIFFFYFSVKDFICGKCLSQNYSNVDMVNLPIKWLIVFIDSRNMFVVFSDLPFQCEMEFFSCLANCKYLYDLRIFKAITLL